MNLNCCNINLNVFSYKNHKTGNMMSFNFYKNNEKIGCIDYYIEYTQITIIWLIINQELNGLGYGSRMLSMFINYILKMKMKNKNKKNNMNMNQNMNKISKIILIPINFDGKNKNWLCNFYEKNGFTQEKYGYPFYIHNILE